MITLFPVPNRGAKRICASWLSYEDAIYEWLNKPQKETLEKAIDIELEKLCLAITTYANDARLPELLKQELRPITDFMDDKEAVTREAHIAANTGKRPQKHHELIKFLAKQSFDGAPPKTVDDLIQMLRADHELVRQLGKRAFAADRIESKKLKKKIVSCLGFSSLCVGSIACNSFFPPSQAFSYSIGSGAFFAAIAALK